MTCPAASPYDEAARQHATPPHVCFASHRHHDRIYARVCLTCVRELIGRVDELERNVRALTAALAKP